MLSEFLSLGPVLLCLLYRRRRDQGNRCARLRRKGTGRSGSRGRMIARRMVRGDLRVPHLSASVWRRVSECAHALEASLNVLMHNQ